MSDDALGQTMDASVTAADVSMKALRCVAMIACLGVPLGSAWAAEPVEAFALGAQPASASKPVEKPAKKAAAKKPAKQAKAGKTASKSKARKEADAIAAPVPQAKLDLSLPKDMVKEIKPPGKPAAAAARDGVLPSLFSERKSEDAFRLNGRLLSNEMQLQLRDDHTKVEGAALEFQFKQ